MQTSGIGISGFACYLPGYRVRLEDWCGWTGNAWDKVQEVVGYSYRLRGPDENAYTMAATAALRLILRNDVDPDRIGLLGLGTESSTDNSAGAVIVKGMVNVALRELGLSPVRRACEVPEFKHACLGGVYALKAAARYLAVDGSDKVAVVVCSDVAEYRRDSSGEPTQGAGAVAMLVEPRGRLLAMDLHHTGSSSAYRGVDFRKPMARFAGSVRGPFVQLRDHPVFNGKYSTTCYLDAVLAAGRDYFSQCGGAPAATLRDMAAIFLHRPYQRMSETGLAFCYLLALALGDAEDLDELGELAAATDVPLPQLIDELREQPDVEALLADGDLAAELFPLASAAARVLRGLPAFAGLMTSLGIDAMRHTGNLYTASLPAWMAAGIEQAATEERELGGRRVLTVGYGSGDAAEFMPMRFVDGWQAAARRIDFAGAMAGGRDVDAAEYAALHAGDDLGERISRPGVFYIDSIGERRGHFDDSGIEYYRYQG
ncbi:MAG: hydroxymethylglutaryl-CoA synthase [Pseudomonadales bacterium]